MYNIEAHGRQRHAGQYVRGTKPHGGRAGERHLQRPRVVAVADGAEQHEAEEHAVQVGAAARARVQPVQHGRAACDVRRHECEPDQQQRHEAGAVRGRGRGVLCGGHRGRGRRRGRRGCGRPVRHALEHVVRVARPYIVRLERVAGRERFHVHCVLLTLALQLHSPLFFLHQLLVVTAVTAFGT